MKFKKYQVCGLYFKNLPCSSLLLSPFSDPCSSPSCLFPLCENRWTWIFVIIKKNLKKWACFLKWAVLFHAILKEMPACLWYRLIWWREEPWDIISNWNQPIFLYRPPIDTNLRTCVNCWLWILHSWLFGLFFFKSLDPISNVIWWWSVKFVETTSSGPFLQQIST